MPSSNAQRLIVTGALIVAVWTMSPNRAVAWGQGGHRVVANIAYDQLTPEQRSKVVNTLRKHKDFAKQFGEQMDKEIPNASAEEKDRWIFLHAAIWPDLIRGLREYDHRSWHYVNLPYYLTDSDELALKNSRLQPNTSTTLPTPLTSADKEGLNCIQAFKLAALELSDSHSTDEERAVYYCWLLHIAGDVHQPLHSTSLRTRGRFIQPEGDRGGGLIRINHDTKGLHHFWDSLYGEQQSMKSITDKTRDLLTDDVKKAAEKARDKTDVTDWVLESHKLAKEFVYSKEVLEVVTAGESSNKPLKSADLADDYQKRAKQIADQRVATAGYRLAEILKQLD